MHLKNTFSDHKLVGGWVLSKKSECMWIQKQQQQLNTKLFNSIRDLIYGK